MECQRINNSHSFLTVLLISHKYPAIARSLAPWSLPDLYPIAPWSAEAVMSNFFLVSEAAKMNPPSKIAFLTPVCIQWMNLITEYPSGWPWIPNQPNVQFLCRVQRDLLDHKPPHKGKPFQTTTLSWVYFPQMTWQFFTLKTLPKYFNELTKNWWLKGTSLSIIYFIKYSCGGFVKIGIMKFIYVIFHIFYRIFVFLSWT